MTQPDRPSAVLSPKQIADLPAVRRQIDTSIPIVRRALARAQADKGAELEDSEIAEVWDETVDADVREAERAARERDRAADTRARRAARQALCDERREAQIRARLRCAVDVELTATQWLWRRRLPIGELTLIESDPGVGKSTVLTDLVARNSTGRPMPNEDEGLEPADSLWIGEEPPARVVQRFMAAGGDRRRLHFLPPEDVMLPSSEATLRDAVAMVNPTLVVVDTIEDILDPEVNPWRGPDVRAALEPLCGAARQAGAAVVATRHLRKSGGPAAHRGQGSVAFLAKSRAAFALVQREDRIFMAAVKASLSRRPPTLALRMRQAPHTEDLATVHWLGEDPRTADELMAPPPGPSAKGDAGEWLREQLEDGPVPVATLQDRAQRDEVSWRTVQRAKNDLSVRAYRRTGSGGPRWEWGLPGEQTQGRQVP